MTPTLDVTFALRDLRLRAFWPNATLAEAGARVLDYHGFAPAPSAEPGVPWTFDFRAPVRVPSGAEHVATHATGLNVLRSGTHLYLAHDESVVRVDPEHERAEGQLSPPSSSQASAIDADLYLVLTFALLLLFQRRGFYAVHGAALCSDDGEGVLLVADSDSGKSTMATLLIRQGWRYLTDDSFFLYSAADAVEARPFRRDFGLDPDAADLFPEIAEARTTQLTDASKWRVAIDRLFPSQRAERCRPRLLLFPHIAHQPTTELHPLTQAEALARLMQQCSFLDPDPAQAQEHLRVLNRLTAQTRRFRLLAGRDLLDEQALLGEILSDYMA